MHRTFLARFYTLALTLSLSLAAQAIPALGLWQTGHLADGTTVEVQLCGDETSHHYRSADGNIYMMSAEGVLQPVSPADLSRRMSMAPRRTAGLFPNNNFPRTGSPRGIAILVEYTDVKFRTDYNPREYFSRLLNEEGFSDNGATGSARDYFIENSGGRFTPDFDVYGPVTLPNPRSYYGANSVSGSDLRPYEMVIHGCELLDDQVDFSIYDTDKDGVIDNVFVFYAGQGEAAGGGEDSVWPHAWEVRYSLGTFDPDYIYDGVVLNRYACSNELLGNRLDGIGTFVHEFSHVMGLPDLYAVGINQGYNPSFTPGAWSAMDGGCYNNNSNTPPHYSAFELGALGWLEPEILDGATSVRLEDIRSNRACMIVNPTNANEYFLIENRQREGWDSYIPGHGMLVWHVDYSPSIWTSNTVNNYPTHQYVDILEADGIQDEATRAGDSFPGTAGIRSLSPDTNPALRFWNGDPAGLPISGITESKGVITFDVGAGRDKPEAVEALDAFDVTPYSFIAQWRSAPDASAYNLVVTDADSRIVLDVNTSRTYYTVSSLMPASTYRYTVRVLTLYGESELSNEVEVTTVDLPFEERRPNVLEPTDITPGSFTANWQAMPGAESYELSVFTKYADGCLLDECGFDNFPAELPEGWASSVTSSYAMASMSGKSSPSVRLNDTGDNISSPDYPDGVSQVSFWMRASSGTEGEAELSARTPDGVKLISSYDVEHLSTGSEGQTWTTTAIPAGTTGITITFRRTSERGSLAIDDVAVGHGTAYSRNYLADYSPLATGELSCKVDGLAPGHYFYTVRAVSGDTRTLESDEAEANTGQSGLDAAVDARPFTLDGRLITSATAITVTDVYGRTAGTTGTSGGCVEVPCAGVYIVSSPRGIFKIIAR